MVREGKGGRPLPLWGSGGITPWKFSKIHAKSCILVTTCCEILAFWKRSTAKKLGTNSLLVPQPKSWGWDQSPPVSTVVAPMRQTTLDYNYTTTVTITISNSQIFLSSDETITLCKRLSESMISIVEPSFSLLQAARTAQHVLFWGYSVRKWVTVSGLLQE